MLEQSTLAATQTLEERLVLAGTYGFDVIATVGVTANSVSVNDFADVSYQNGQRVFVGDGLAAPVAVDEPATDPNLIANPGLQINNDGLVAETTRGVGPGNPRADLWDGLADPGDGTRIALGAPAVFYFKDIAPVSSLNNDGLMAFAGNNGTQWEVHLADARVDMFSPETLVTTVPVGATFNLMAGEGDRVVVGSETGGVETIELFDSTGTNTSTVIASSANPMWDEIGINPGISDNGSVVVFYGDLNQNGATQFGVLAGPGIFASIPTGPSLQDRTIIRVDGDLGRTTGGAQINFAGFNEDGRVNVLHQEYGRPGIDDDALVVSYIATPSAASPAGASTDPLVFTANTGIFTSHVDINSIAARDVRLNQPLRAIQVGDPLAGETVTAVSLHDGLSNPLLMPNGLPREPRRGDHYLAFQANTDQGSSVAARANYLNPNTDAAAAPPRKTRLTGPVLLADDLTPTVTWANLPGVAVDSWDVLGYHILSGKQVMNLSVVGSQTAVTLPTQTELGTHEFWIRGRNAAGVEPWSIGHRLYFHVVAPELHATSVQITGPVSSVFDDTPHISWDAFPNATTYDALVYSVSRGVEVARVEGATGSSFELPRLSTQDTYAVHMRAHTIFGGTTHWSAAHLFRIDASSPPLPDPTNIAPNSYVANNQPVFTWDPIPGAWVYDVRLDDVFGPNVATETVDTPTFATPVVLSSGPYQFSVRARNDALEATNWVTVHIYIVSSEFDLDELFEEQERPLVPAEGALPDLPTIDGHRTVPVVYYGNEPRTTAESPVPDGKPSRPVLIKQSVAAETGSVVSRERTSPVPAPVEAGSAVDGVFTQWCDSDEAAGIFDEERQAVHPAAAGLLGAAYLLTRRERSKSNMPANAAGQRPKRRRR